MRGCYRRSAKKKKKEEGELCGAFWSLEEVIGKKRGKKGKKKRIRVHVWRRKKEEKKKGKKKEMQYVCGGEQKKEILS